MRVGADDLVTRAAAERAYRADATFILSIAPWMFLVGMSVEAASHWAGAQPLLFWAPAAMALCSLGVLVGSRRWGLGRRYPDGWLLMFWLFMLSTPATHLIMGTPDQIRLSQLVFAVTVVATGGLVLPTLAGSLALAGASFAFYLSILAGFSGDLLNQAVVPVIVTFMAVLIFLARRWAIRQSLRVRLLDQRLSESVAQAEAARRVADLSMRMSAGFAHHFNNQLQGALMGAEGVRREVGPGHSAQPWVELVETAVRRGIDLTGQLLRYAQPARMNRARLSAGAFLAGLDFRSVTGGGREVLTHAADVDFTGDEAQLGGAVLELVRNADAALAGRPDPVRVEVADAGDAAEILVIDTGPGIPATLDGRPTDPFVTGDPVKRFGLGLSTVAQIAEQHGGALTLSPRVRGGTVAKIRLPKSAVAVRSEPIAAQAGGPRGGSPASAPPPRN